MLRKRQLALDLAKGRKYLPGLSLLNDAFHCFPEQIGLYCALPQSQTAAQGPV
jgi:hypothetical protein